MTVFCSLTCFFMTVFCSLLCNYVQNNSRFKVIWTLLRLLDINFIYCSKVTVMDSSARVVRRLALGWEGVGGPAVGAPAHLVVTTPHRRPPAPCWGERCLRP